MKHGLEAILLAIALVWPQECVALSGFRGPGAGSGQRRRGTYNGEDSRRRYLWNPAGAVATGKPAPLAQPVTSPVQDPKTEGLYEHDDAAGVNVSNGTEPLAPTPAPVVKKKQVAPSPVPVVKKEPEAPAPMVKNVSTNATGQRPLRDKRLIQGLHSENGPIKEFIPCDTVHLTSNTVLVPPQEGYVFSFAEQMWIFAHLTAEACRLGYNVATKLYIDIREDDTVDVVDLLDLEATNNRLRTNAFREKMFCPPAFGTEEEANQAKLSCSQTQIVPFHCVGSVPKKVVSQSVEMFPKIPRMLYSMVPTTGLTWNKNMLESNPYNAVHFDLDIDRILFLCDYGLWYKWVSNGLSKNQEMELVGRNGRHAFLVTNVAIPAYIDAMKVIFQDKTLPVAIVTSLTRVTKATNWIYSAFEDAIKRASLAKIVLSSEGLAFGREVNAAADLRVLSGGKSVVLVPGSTFSETAAIHTIARGGKVGYTADFRRTCFPSAWPKSGNGAFGENQTSIGRSAECLELAGMDFPAPQDFE